MSTVQANSLASSEKVRIETVRDSAALDEFVRMPWQIYGGKPRAYPLWVPNLASKDRELLDPDRHPFWQNARRELFLARSSADGRLLGRIAAIVDNDYNEYAKVRCGAFGFFECRNDPVAARALFAVAEAWLRDQGMEFMRGPLNPSTNYTCGMLVDGFDLAPCIMMPWNPPYYPALLDSLGFAREKDLYGYLIATRDMKQSGLEHAGALERVKKRFPWRVSSRKTLKQDIAAMLQIYRESWADNWGFSPLSDNEAEALIHELGEVLDPKYFGLYFHKDEPIGGVVALPDMNPLLARLDGKLGLLTPWHFWQVRKDLKRCYRIILFGVKKRYRLLGVPYLLVDGLIQKLQVNPAFEWIEASWVLEDNQAVSDVITGFGGQLRKRYRIYRRELAR